MNVTRGLIIDTPWIDHILEGRKDWEMRAQPTAIRCWIGLIRKGTGKVVGLAELVECGKALGPEEMVATFGHHRIPEQMIRSGEVAKWVVPWKLTNIRPLARPVPYDHKSGAVIWVTLSEEVSRQLSRDSLVGQRICVSFDVQSVDGVVDGAVEDFCVGEGLMGEIIGFEGNHSVGTACLSLGL